MASKLRRTPLFGCDGNLGIPIIPKQGNSNGSATKSQKSSSSYEYKVYKMQLLLLKSIIDIATEPYNYVNNGLPVSLRIIYFYILNLGVFYGYINCIFPIIFSFGAILHQS